MVDDNQNAEFLWAIRVTSGRSAVGFLGKHDLDEMLAERDKLNNDNQGKS